MVKEKHAATAFSGEGAYRSGGRWNSVGIRVVYASATQSLAALENLVHLNPKIAFRYAAFRIEFDAVLLEQFPADILPANWTEEPPPPSTQAIGDRWVREARSAVLGLPSIVVRGETNYLFNPAHPDFRQISLGPPEPFAFDPRLLA